MGDDNELKLVRTGLEQDLNAVVKVSGVLSVPEIVPAARQMAADGIVLLKNENKLLPLRAEQTVAVFGRCAVNYFVVGYGSGGDVIPPYRSSLMDGLRKNGVKVEEKLAERYAQWCAVPGNLPDESAWGQWPMSYPEMPLTEEVVAEAAKDSDAALVVIGRAAGEDRENLLEPGSYYLTDDEKQMLDFVTAHFNKVCVVMDCGNVIDMGWTEDYGNRIQAIVYAWQGGMEGGFAAADVLYGKVNPSGRLTDTIARRYEDYPSSAHFGGKAFNAYAEDIYVGYRYFETFAKKKALYPFGFGLSYTQFAMQAQAQREGDEISVSVEVKNTGDIAGREVVQCYLTLPCGVLGNPAKVLAAFAKTGLLKPGQSEMLKLRVDLADFASYDDAGATGNKSCRVLQAGVYGVEVGANVRDTERVLEFTLDALHVVERLHENMAVKPESRFQRMVNHAGEIAYEDVPVQEKDIKAEILAQLPAELHAEAQDIPFADVLSGKRSAEEFVAQLTDEELDDITHGQGLMNSCYGPDGNAGAFGGVTDRLRARGLPAMITTDGPSGIRIRETVALLPCGTALASTFDTEGVEQLYSLVAKEMEHFDTHMLLGPGMNIHRNPLCGRNFEYFSEDPYLTGKMAAAMVRGVQSTGRSACVKHFACNNQERFRNRNDSQVSERALREIYLKGFEIAIKEAKPLAVMTSYNKVNGVWSHYHYELATEILRNEWGYDGLVITDWWMQEGESREFPNLRNDAVRVRAQVDVLMPGVIGEEGDLSARTLVPSLRDPDGVTRGEAQRCALNVIRFIERVMHATGKA